MPELHPMLSLTVLEGGRQGSSVPGAEQCAANLYHREEAAKTCEQEVFAGDLCYYHGKVASQIIACHDGSTRLERRARRAA